MPFFYTNDFGAVRTGYCWTIQNEKPKSSISEVSTLYLPVDPHHHFQNNPPLPESCSDSKPSSQWPSLMSSQECRRKTYILVDSLGSCNGRNFPSTTASLPGHLAFGFKFSLKMGSSLLKGPGMTSGKEDILGRPLLVPNCISCFQGDQERHSHIICALVALLFCGTDIIRPYSTCMRTPKCQKV